MLTSIYIALTYFQPGIVLSSLAEFRPMLIASCVAGLVAIFNRSSDKAYILRHPITRFLFLFIGLQACSVYYSGARIVFEELSFWYVYPAFLIIVTFSVTSLYELRQAIWGLILGSSFVVCYGIVAVFYEFEASQVLQGRAGAYGMYMNHNDYTFLIILIFPFAVKLFFAETGAVKKTILAAIISVSILGMFLSLSRGGILGFVLEIVLLGWFSGRRAARTFLAPLLLVVGVAVIQYQFSARDQASEGYDTARSTYVRKELWRTGYKMLKAHPLLGVGSRRFADFSPDYTDLSHSNIGLNSHNTFIEVFSTSGILGGVSFLGMLYFCLKELLSRKMQSLPPGFGYTREAMLIALVGLSFRSLFDAKPHEWGFYTLAALILSFAAILKKEEEYAGT